MTGAPEDVEPTLAEALGVDPAVLARAVGAFSHAGSEWDGDVLVFTGRANPRAPERPVVAIRVETVEGEAEVGRAVGVPLPDGRFRWTLATPRVRVGMADRERLIDELAAAVVRVLDADMLKGVDW